MFSNHAPKVTICGRLDDDLVRPTGYRGTNRVSKAFAKAIRIDRKIRRRADERMATAEITGQLDDARDVINPVVVKSAPAPRPLAYAGYGHRGVLRLQHAA
jgi:hypothetical protein